MYIFLYPDGTIDVRDTWALEYKPPYGTMVYEPSDSLTPWTIQESNGPRALSKDYLPSKCKAVELLYPRDAVTHDANVRAFLKNQFKG